MMAEACFRLIEWFVAGTIFAIAIIVPVVRHFKQQAIGVPCLFNFRQLAVAWKSYSSYHHNRIIRNPLSHASVPVHLMDSGVIIPRRNTVIECMINCSL
jgi:hypothetical protein